MWRLAQDRVVAVYGNDRRCFYSYRSRAVKMDADSKNFAQKKTQKGLTNRVLQALKRKKPRNVSATELLF